MDTCSFAAAGTTEGGGVMKDDFEFLRGLANCQDKEQMDRYIEEHQPKPMTNADRIRSMSDEELAELLLDGCRGSKCDAQPINEWGSVNCFQCRIKWLQQPVKEMR